MAHVRVLSVASEVYPVLKTGGLADVTGALPKALVAEDVSMRTLLPGYPAVMRALENAATVLSLRDLFGGEGRVIAGTAGELDLLVLDAPHLFAREGNPYSSPDGADWPDNAFRFAALARAAAAIAQGALERYQPDVVHAHDWQAGLTAAYLQYSGRPHPATVITIHNLAFQGNFPLELLSALGLPPEAASVDGLEFYGNLSYLKAALQFSDRITTVSPTYALEILTPAGGMAFDGLLRRRASVLSGILNGIDAEVWDPATDPLIAAPFDLGTLAARAGNTAALQARLGLTSEPNAFVVGIVSRFSSQKGLDLVLEAVPQLTRSGAQVAVLGAGDPELERAFADAVVAYPGRIGCQIGYDESLAHLIQAGSTAILVPSRFEPCGLTQLCALRYGAVPIVSRVGGLADTVIEANEMSLAAGVATGFIFSPPETAPLEGALARAMAFFGDSVAWTQMQTSGMTADVSWRRPAHRYANLYRELLALSPV